MIITSAHPSQKNSRQFKGNARFQPKSKQSTTSYSYNLHKIITWEQFILVIFCGIFMIVIKLTNLRNLERMFPLNRNQSSNLHCTSMDWFLHVGNIGIKWIKSDLYIMNLFIDHRQGWKTRDCIQIWPCVPFGSYKCRGKSYYIDTHFLRSFCNCKLCREHLRVWSFFSVFFAILRTIHFHSPQRKTCLFLTLKISLFFYFHFISYLSKQVSGS